MVVSVDDLNQRIWNLLDRVEPYLDQYFPEGGPPDPPDPPPDGTTYTRPAESMGTGCFVAVTPDGRQTLCDGNGVPFRIRGTCKCHQDTWSSQLDDTRSNATRWIARQEPWIPYTAADFIKRLKEQPGGLSSRCIQVLGFWDGTCEDAQYLLDEMVSTWIEGIPDYSEIERYAIINIANEWGNDPVAWRDAYIEAVGRLRRAGWHGCIMVDAPGCGQNGGAIHAHGREVFESDPERNTIFSWHIYGAVFDSEGGTPKTYDGQVDLVPTMDAIASSGLYAVIGEFGPGQNIGPSPTPITPARIVQVAEEHGFGWMSWSWDDNNQDSGQADDNSFCHVYDSNADELGENLTDFGNDVSGLWQQFKATPATVEWPSTTVGPVPSNYPPRRTPRFERRAHRPRC